MSVILDGQVADMDAIHAIVDKDGLAVIEDTAQSFSASYQNTKRRNTSTFRCTSDCPSKPLSCDGDGGAVFTNDDAVAQACREIRTHGQSPRYFQTRLGVGGRMDTLQCAVVLGKLDRVEWEVSRRLAPRAECERKLKATGVPTAVHSRRPLHHQPAFYIYCCSNSIAAANRVTCLAMSAGLTEEQQNDVAHSLANILRNAV